MTRGASVVLFLLAACQPSAFAQQAGDGLNDQQRLGRQILAQSCAVCHLPSGPKAQTYGPPLNKAAAGGDDAVMRSTILDGTVRMPGFKYYLQPAQIDAIIAYVRTIPAPAPAPAAPR
jgi:mono/diheme cytochrome c family protein